MAALRHRIRRAFCAVLAAALLCIGIPETAKGDAATLREFAAEMEEHTALLESSFSVSCTQEVMEQLKKPSSVSADSILLSEIMQHAGTYGAYTYTWRRDSVMLADVSYRAGWRILHLLEQGRKSELSPRELKILDEAYAVIAGASGSDLEKERYIYDRLCERITYEITEDGTRDKDSAVGALLNGRADCDGYADAMLLCCGLAGIPCRYMNGDSLKPSELSSPDGGHTWNLVYIGGSWLMCDVTWGDADKKDPSYLFFNLGTQDAAASYVWERETLFTPVAADADYAVQLLPDQRPYTAYSLEDVYRAARSAVSAGRDHFTLFCPGEALWETRGEDFVSAIRRGAVGAYSYNDTGRLFAVYAVSLPENDFRFADSEQEALDAISGYADRNVRTFTLYFHPDLAGRLFANDHDALKRLLSVSRLAKPGTYQYSEQAGRITVEDAAFIGSLPYCASVDEVISLLARELPGQPESVSFLLPDTLSFESIREEIAAAVYSRGVNTMYYSVIGNRVMLNQLAYYDDYCLAETKNDVLGYMQRVKANGGKELRVYCTEKLYASLVADNAYEFFAMLRKAGFRDYSVSHSDHYRLMVAEELR